MPIYEYRCDACGHELEQMQKISDPPLTDCPACGRPALRKQISAAAFRLKGGGWYETDFKKSNQKNLHEGGESKTEKTEKKETPATDGKVSAAGDKAGAAAPKPDTAKPKPVEKKPAA